LNIKGFVVDGGKAIYGKRINDGSVLVMESYWWFDDVDVTPFLRFQFLQNGVRKPRSGY
jgi:hypothetical protein